MTSRPACRCFLPFLLAVAALCGDSAQAGAPSGSRPLTLEGLRVARKQLAQKPRGIIFNNDGCDVLYFPGKLAVTAENLLADRTTPLADSQVSTIAYCSISSGFSYFTHATKAGQVLVAQPAAFGIDPSARNVAQDLIDHGADCLEVMVRFAHRHHREIFWSMRMNDTHDVEHTPQKPYLLYPKLKTDHPEWLVGDPVKRSCYGRWSSVDYAVPEIRQAAFSYVEEVCRNYDVDGVELDFFRHLCYFKSTAHGGKASPAECDMMTGMLRRTREMSEREGLRRGRPILVAVRVPDSVEFSRDMGLDIERWLRESLVDLLVTTCYFRLNPWSYSTELGHRYGVPVYPCLSDSRVQGEERFARSSIESYRGRAMNAWNARADGIHVFNLGDPKTLRAMRKIYFATVRDGNPNSYLAKGTQYCRLPILTPLQPGCITPGKPLTVPIEIGDHPAWAGELRRTPYLTLHLWFPRLRRAEDVAVSLGEHAMAPGRLAEGWIDCPVPVGAWSQGINEVKVAIRPESAPKEGMWSFEYLPTQKPPKPWTRDPGSTRTEDKLVAGGLLIADRGRENGDYCYYRYPWGASPDTPTVIEARVKVLSGVNCVIFTNGSAQMRLELHPDRINLWKYTSYRYAMNAADNFHLYRIETHGRDVKVFVDGTLRINAPGVFGPGESVGNQLAFGAANSPEVGEACWAMIRGRVANQVCQDVAASVEWKP